MLQDCTLQGAVQGEGGEDGGGQEHHAGHGQEVSGGGGVEKRGSRRTGGGGDLQDVVGRLVPPRPEGSLRLRVAHQLEVKIVSVMTLVKLETRGGGRWANPKRNCFKKSILLLVLISQFFQPHGGEPTQGIQTINSNSGSSGGKLFCIPEDFFFLPFSYSKLVLDKNWP